jgi:hypothetical protein
MVNLVGFVVPRLLVMNSSQRTLRHNTVHILEAFTSKIR